MQVIDDVFSTVVLVHPCGAPEDAKYPILEMEMEKETWAALNYPVGHVFPVTIAPDDLLLLR